MKKHTKIIAMITLVSLLMMILSACSSEQNIPDLTTQPVLTDAPAAEPAVQPEAETVTGRQDGERFESVIILEGMEETVKYEHVRNSAIGFEMDYDYESLVRRSEADRECFVSVYDKPEAPENYLEVTFRAENAETAADSIGEALSKDYEISRSAYLLDHAGSCTVIDASATKDGQTPDRMQKVYIIPAPDGCIVATAHYFFEGAEGFGRRFSYMVNTLAVIARNK